MKITLNILVLFVSIICFGQDKIDIKISLAGPTFETVQTIDSLVMKNIYRLGRTAIIKAFKDSKDVIQLDDIEEGKLFARGITSYQWVFLLTVRDINVWFDLDFQARDGKYRIFVDNLIMEWYVDGHGLQTQTFQEFCDKRKGKNGKETCDGIRRNLTNVIESLVYDIRSGSVNSDW